LLNGQYNHQMPERAQADAGASNHFCNLTDCSWSGR
jgi:hypothetical protein